MVRSQLQQGYHRHEYRRWIGGHPMEAGGYLRMLLQSPGKCWSSISWVWGTSSELFCLQRPTLPAWVKWDESKGFGERGQCGEVGAVLCHRNCSGLGGMRPEFSQATFMYIVKTLHFTESQFPHLQSRHKNSCSDSIFCEIYAACMWKITHRYYWQSNNPKWKL